MTTSHRGMAPLLSQAGAIAAGTRADIAEVMSRWHDTRRALAPISRTPIGMAALLKAGSAAIADATAFVERAKSRYRDLAAGVDALTAGLPDPGVAHSFDTGLGPVPAAPSPARPPYPQNDVIAEATDLDGNVIVLRRGYYDSLTRQGWGWDKIQWKHGVTDVDVFRDLISHSRPRYEPGGTLVYDVTINRSRCGKNIIGYISCSDTGESLTMHIVANATAPRFDVPDGGPKGVISMYPLKDGSGVVEIAPDWTVAPPWISSNEPIN